MNGEAFHLEASGTGYKEADGDRRNTNDEVRAQRRVSQILAGNETGEILPGCYPGIPLLHGKVGCGS